MHSYESQGWPADRRTVAGGSVHARSALRTRARYRGGAAGKVAMVTSIHNLYKHLVLSHFRPSRRAWPTKSPKTHYSLSWTR